MQKGMVLIAVPLVFEFVFVAGLFMLLRRADLQVERAAHTQKLITEVQKLQSSVTRAAYSIAMLALKKSELSTALSQAAVDSLPESLSEIKNLSQKDEHESKIVAKLIRDSQEMSEQLQRLRLSIIDAGISSSIQLLATCARDIDRLMMDITSSSEQICSYDYSINRVALESKSKTRQGLLLWLAGGLFANLSLAVLLTVYLNKSTVSRLNILTKNTRLFESKQPLLPALEGRDELAELDQVFHGMAESIMQMEKTKEEFYQMITHDLRSPLSGTMLTLEMACNGSFGELPQQATKRLESARQNCSRLISLINQLIDVAKLESGTLSLNVSELNTEDFLQQAVTSVRGLVEASKIELLLENRGPERFSGDLEALTRVLTNLIANSVKFMESGKKIILASSLSQPEEIEFSVIDQGPGIPADQLPLIFERFRQVNLPRGQRRKEGAGLGLYICKRIVEAHAGSIGAESKLGEGSRFWFRIPIKHSEETRADNSEAPDAQS